MLLPDGNKHNKAFGTRHCPRAERSNDLYDVSVGKKELIEIARDTHKSRGG